LVHDHGYAVESENVFAGGRFHVPEAIEGAPLILLDAARGHADIGQPVSEADESGTGARRENLDGLRFGFLTTASNDKAFIRSGTRLDADGG